MRALGTLSLALVLVSIPFASACYRPRVQSCRGPLGDFSGISNVAISRAEEPLAFESATASVVVVVTASDTAPDGNACVAVHAELRDAAGGLVDQLDTPIAASVSGGVLETTPLLFYQSSSLTPMTVHVTLLGTTVDAEVIDASRRDAGFFTTDAFVARDAGPAPRDASVRDASADGGVAADGGDASVTDASMADASTADAGIDATP